ncbi:MAG TPA: FliH/SctL family protein [Actinophytocola sp.]|uniref:FliH/SctL family protein n=1 Tax=Actinophytocola sp. TaxID=1872138 RepID=UPI002DB73328|nr:FliH/SctL family protein [Actinophytocola sp.]HEU5474212.1 FliH/SctL family protein [Actinophytocola sp.]
MTDWNAAVVSPEVAQTAVPYQVGAVASDTQGTNSVAAIARAEGYAVGWSQGMREARESTNAARRRAEQEMYQMLRRRDQLAKRSLRALASSSGEVRTVTVQRTEEITEFIVAEAIDLAEAILGAALSADVLAITRNAVARALKELPVTGPAVTVRLNPDDHTELTATDFSDVVGVQEVSLVADPDLAPGDAVATNAVSTVEVTVAGALARVRKELAS